MRRHWPFIALLGLTAVARFLILFVAQKHVMSDEAIVGLMAKHILEGRSLPFYLYGVSYSGSGAWEAYLAVIPFAIFGVGVTALKSCTVVVSLVCLALFYAMATRLHGRTLAALIFALWPALLKWHFQPKGYAFYFLSIPLLVILFLILESQKTPSTRNAFFFGLASGISVWSLELILPIVAVFWALLLLRRKFSLGQITMSIFGVVLGYAPVIWWNFAHSFANWRFLLFEKPEAAGLLSRLGPSAWRDIFVYEMPKFFGPDTVLWYYPETSWIGYVMYGVAIIAIVVAAISALRWKQIRDALSAGFTASETNKDLLMLILIAASFVPYVVAPMRVPGYFLAACFFLSILIARLITRCPRFVGATILSVVIVCGVATIIQTATRDQIETLVLRKKPWDYSIARIPGADIDAIERDLAQNHIHSVWTTISFVYPLIFESRETLVASESIFGIERSFYPSQIPKSEPRSDERAVFVIETNSPLRAEIETTCAQKGGAAPRIAEHGTLTVIEERLASEL